MKPNIIIALGILPTLSVSCSKIESLTTVQPSEEEISTALERAGDNYRRETLEEKFAALQSAQPLLSRVRISKVEFHEVDRGYETEVKAEFHNGTKEALAAIVCRVIERDPNRTIPHTDEEVTFFFQGGIEPGETKSEDSTGFQPADAQGLKRSVIVIKLLGPGYRSIADGSMSDLEISELKEIQSRN